MKISYNWLKDFIALTETPAQMDSILTGTGLEVESIEKINTIKGGLEGIVVGEVMTCERFEVKEKQLSLTTVDVGQAELATIVCAAANVAAGQKVIVATVNSTIYPIAGEPFTIGKRKVYGHPSEGMICAEDEIGIGTSHDGILILKTDLPNGTPAATYFKVEPDYLIEIGLTPNRGDAASHFGVARDLRAALERPISLPSISAFQPTETPRNIEVSIEDTAGCPRFCGLEITGITVQESPDWLKNKLKAIGLNPINNIVDITNYMCHGFGQPMHAFDADEITGNQIIVKTLEKGTPFITLDGKQHELSGFDLMVCNAQEPMGIAGIFGGLKSGIKETTKRVFLEVAYFDPTVVRKTASFHSLKTDASFHYERGTDPNMPPYIIRLAALLIQELAGGQIVNDVQDVYPTKIENLVIDVQHQHINRLIGKNIDDRKIHSILKNLDIEVISDDKTTLKVSVPPYRMDVTRSADVIEEILRIYGFENVEQSPYLKADYISDFPANDPTRLQQKVSEILAGAGVSEIMNLSLSSPKWHEAILPELKGDNVVMLNPLSEDLSVMRQSLLFSGLKAISHNINRRQKDLKFFEFGRIYFRKTNQEGKNNYKEEKVLALWMTGNKTEETWQHKSQPVDFQYITMAVQRVFKAMRIATIDTQATTVSYFSEGLDFIVNKKKIGSVGLVKSNLLKLTDVRQPVFYADLDWEYLLKQYSNAAVYQEVSKFPEVRRDLSLVIDKAVSFDIIQKIANKTERNLLKSVNVFDTYEGQNLGAEKKSYSVSFILLDTEKTLTDDVIDKTMQRLMAAFEKEIGAVIRK